MDTEAWTQEQLYTTNQSPIAMWGSIFASGIPRLLSDVGHSKLLLYEMGTPGVVRGVSVDRLHVKFAYSPPALWRIGFTFRIRTARTFAPYVRVKSRHSLNSNGEMLLSQFCRVA